MSHGKELHTGPSRDRKRAYSAAVSCRTQCWIASFLAVTVLFAYGFLDQILAFPWILGLQDRQAPGAQQLVRYRSEVQEWPDCLSRSQHALYFRPSRLFPVSHKLLTRMEQYERMHRRCVAERDLDAEVDHPGNTQPEGEDPPCRYLYFPEVGGLGNRMLGFTTAYVYALLTNRAMLMGHFSPLASLICNPFPTSSLSVPRHFPQKALYLKAVELEDSSLQDFSKVSVVKVKEQHNSHPSQRRFYCTSTMEKLSRVKWVVLDTNQYLIPRFFATPYLWLQMRDLLGDEPTLIFTHLSRLLLLPRNLIWDRVMRIYWTHLADTDKRVGVQIRRHMTTYRFDQTSYDRIMQCLIGNSIIPNTTQPVAYEELPSRDPRPVFNVTPTLNRLSDQLRAVRAQGSPQMLLLSSRRLSVHLANSSSSPENIVADRVEHGRPTSVFIASLNPEYYEEMKRQYTNNPTTDGSLIRVFQMTADKDQTYEFAQLADALTEMWLLAFSDEIATSGWSTFGYIAHGIAGLRPWIMDLKGGGRPRRKIDVPCWQAWSQEPCNHFPFLESVCIDSVTNQTEASMGPEQAAWMLRHTRTCRDEVRGIQLLD